MKFMYSIGCMRIPRSGIEPSSWMRLSVGTRDTMAEENLWSMNWILISRIDLMKSSVRNQ